jgi:hypothetical protein
MGKPKLRKQRNRTKSYRGSTTTPQEGNDARRRCRRDWEVKGFHPEPYREEDNHNDVPKRVMTPAVVAAVGAELSPEKFLTTLPRTPRAAVF